MFFTYTAEEGSIDKLKKLANRIGYWREAKVLWFVLFMAAGYAFAFGGDLMFLAKMAHPTTWDFAVVGVSVGIATLGLTINSETEHLVGWLWGGLSLLTIANLVKFAIVPSSDSVITFAPPMLCLQARMMYLRRFREFTPSTAAPSGATAGTLAA